VHENLSRLRVDSFWCQLGEHARVGPLAGAGELYILV
jgi:hypothetical protein